MSKESWTQLRPIVEMCQPDGPKTVFDIADALCHRLVELDSPTAIGLDLLPIAPHVKVESGQPLVEAVYDRLKSENVAIIPVVGFDRESELWDMAASYAVSETSGLFVRVEREDIESPDETLDDASERLGASGLDFGDVRLVLDLRSLYAASDANLVALEDEVATFLERLNDRGGAASVSMVGSSIPSNVGEVPILGYQEVHRNELSLWLKVSSFFDSPIGFGDYGIVYPNFSKKPPAPHANGKIRYTRGSSHHIFRGHSLKKGEKYQQYREISSRVLKSPST